MLKAIGTELPPTTRGRRSSVVFAQEARTIRRFPGVWYQVRSAKTSKIAATTAGAIRNGRYGAFPVGEFEAASRGNAVYVRALPAKDAPNTATERSVAKTVRRTRKSAEAKSEDVSVPFSGR